MKPKLKGEIQGILNSTKIVEWVILWLFGHALDRLLQIVWNEVLRSYVNKAILLLSNFSYSRATMPWGNEFIDISERALVRREWQDKMVTLLGAASVEFLEPQLCYRDENALGFMSENEWEISFRLERSMKIRAASRKDL